MGVIMADEDKAEEAMRLLARIDARLESITDRQEDHESRLRQMERSAIQNAFISTGIKQFFWIGVAAVLGWLTSYWGGR